MIDIKLIKCGFGVMYYHGDEKRKADIKYRFCNPLNDPFVDFSYDKKQLVEENFPKKLLEDKSSSDYKIASFMKMVDELE